MTSAKANKKIHNLQYNNKEYFKVYCGRLKRSALHNVAGGTRNSMVIDVLGNSILIIMTNNENGRYSEAGLVYLIQTLTISVGLKKQRSK